MGLALFWVLWEHLGVLVGMGDAGSAGAFHPFHRAWVTEVCLSLDSLLGRRSAGAFSS